MTKVFIESELGGKLITDAALVALVENDKVDEFAAAIRAKYGVTTVDIVFAE